MSVKQEIDAIKIRTILDQLFAEQYGIKIDSITYAGDGEEQTFTWEELKRTA